MDVLHRACAYSRVLEAAQRGYGYTTADIPSYGAELTTLIDRYLIPSRNLAAHYSMYSGAV